jgi:ribosomal protein S18 acetylase RimI-like enzyme
MHVRPIEPHEVEVARQLLLAAGWQRCVTEPQEFAQLLAHSQKALVAVDDRGEVQGFLRALTDGMANGYINMVVVAEGLRGQGVGLSLVRAAVGDNPRITWVLRAGRTEGVGAFYEKCGFSRSQVAMERVGVIS